MSTRSRQSGIASSSQLSSTVRESKALYRYLSLFIFIRDTITCPTQLKYSYHLPSSGRGRHVKFRGHSAHSETVDVLANTGHLFVSGRHATGAPVNANSQAVDKALCPTLCPTLCPDGASRISPPVVASTGVLTVLRRSMVCGTHYQRHHFGCAHDLGWHKGETETLTFLFGLVVTSAVRTFLHVLDTTENDLGHLTKASPLLLVPLSVVLQKSHLFYLFSVYSVSRGHSSQVMDDFGVVHALPDHAVRTCNLHILQLAYKAYHKFMTDSGLPGK